MRIFELAKETGVTSAEVLKVAKSRDLDVSSAISTIGTPTNCVTYSKSLNKSSGAFLYKSEFVTWLVLASWMV